MYGAFASPIPAHDPEWVFNGKYPRKDQQTPQHTPKVPQKYEYERISFNEQVVIRVKLRYVAGVCWSFL